MKYEFIDNGSSLKEKILQLNSVDERNLETDSFFVNYQEEALVTFKKTLLSLRNEKFLIVGDYDCDGICSTTIVKMLLDDLHISNNYYIPSRSKEGYGLNERIVTMAHDNGFTALLMVDNGISAICPIELAKSFSMKTLIIDHHEFVDLPKADAVLHPSLLSEDYQHLCGGGLCALLSNSIAQKDYVTVLGGLATLADLVEVFGYNRYLLKESLRLIKERDIYQLTYLAGKNGISDYRDLSFEVIPKINAVSRMDANVNVLVKYLLSSKEVCKESAGQIEEINRGRKDLTKKMSALALEMIDENDDFILVKSEEFREGLSGLIANKICNQLNKPCLVLAKVDDLYKGSGRAPRDINLYNYLSGCRDLFGAYGGHAQAVGLTIHESKTDALSEYLKKNTLERKEVTEKVIVLKKEELNKGSVDLLESLKPFGPGFSEPLLGIHSSFVESKSIVSKGFPRFVLGRNCSAICFDAKKANVEFTWMTGHLKEDGYRKDSISFFIEDLV